MNGKFFSSGWKNRAVFFQRMEKFFGGFPVNGKIFPVFSSEWKKSFQWLENFPAFC